MVTMVLKYIQNGVKKKEVYVVSHRSDAIRFAANRLVNLLDQPDVLRPISYDITPEQ